MENFLLLSDLILPYIRVRRKDIQKSHWVFIILSLKLSALVFNTYALEYEIMFLDVHFGSWIVLH